MPPTIEHCDGFGHQLLSVVTALTGSNQWFLTASNQNSVETGAGIPQSGLACMKSQPTVTNGASLARSAPAGHQTGWHSVYVRFGVFPTSGEATVIRTTGPTGSPQVAYDVSTGKFSIRFGGSGALTAFGPVISLNTWYCIDFKVDVSTSTFSGTARVDNNAATEATATSTGRTPGDLVTMGLSTSISTGPAFTAYFDSWCYGWNNADYPLGKHEVKALFPNADGTHSAGTNVIEDQAGTDIGVTTAFDKINEAPPETSDYIRQVAVGANYAEVEFEDTTAESIWLVVGFTQMRGSAAGASEGTVRIVSNSGGTLADICTGQGGGTTARSGCLVIPDPGGDGWTTFELNNIKGRLGFAATDVTPNPYFDFLMVQYVSPLMTTVSVGRATTTQVAQVITPVKSGVPQVIAVGRAITTQLAQPISISKAKGVSQALTTNTSQPITHAKSKLTSQAPETETARIITPVKSAVGQTIALTQASETNLAKFMGKVGVPRGLTATVVSPTRVDLQWQPVNGAETYEVVRNSVVIGNPSNPSFSDTTTQRQVLYNYQVRTVY